MVVNQKMRKLICFVLGHNLQIHNVEVRVDDTNTHFEFVTICSCCLEVGRVRVNHKNTDWEELK